ncbi:MAG: HNH endonuclease [Caldilineaceae bacterium]|nr:HNH endonuclease [Caldilineaceae bacterium]
MDRESVLEKFTTLNLFRRDGVRAPHKPLLVILAIGELLRGKGRLLPYSEIDTKLGQLLSEYGPRRTHQGTQYPFWRLQTDGIWEVSDAENVRRTDSGDAFKRDLINYNVRGGFTEEVANQLQNDSLLALEIIQGLLDGHFPDTWHEDILQSAGIELSSKGVIRQKRDPHFRANILKAYEYRCAVCGFDVRLGLQPVALEAAHIKWHQAGGPDLEVNGLALCSLHHKLFDRGAFTLSNELEILVSDEAHGSVGFQEWLMCFHGEKLNFPQRQTYYPNDNFTRWHVKEVFQGDYRER